MGRKRKENRRGVSECELKSKEERNKDGGRLREQRKKKEGATTMLPVCFLSLDKQNYTKNKSAEIKERKTQRKREMSEEETHQRKTNRCEMTTVGVCVCVLCVHARQHRSKHAASKQVQS